jgi:non-ribosomal peptide synthase protein (TIGR01720 family)
MNITEGPLMRALLFHLGEGRHDRLLIIVHHLAIDGISWRILLEDIQELYLALAEGTAAQLPAKTRSFQDWAHGLADCAASGTFLNEAGFWISSAGAPTRGLPLDHDLNPAANIEASARTVTVSLTPEETRDLLQHVPAAYHTRINDALLAAVVEALWNWTGDDTFGLALEGHGREPIVRALDVSRTVGWFTAIFPVVLRRPDQPGVGALLTSVKEQLRRVPHHGIGFGVLAYLAEHPDARRLRSLTAPQLSFNYLGQFGQVLPRSSLFRRARESYGATHGPEGRRPYLLDIRSAVYDDSLQVDWIYSESAHRHETIARVASDFAESLRAIIHHCASPESGGYTPSDFPLATLGQQELDHVVAGRRDIENIYPLSALQAGMLFHALYSPESGAYCMQTRCTIRGPLHVDAFRDAWRQAVLRHPVLRTWVSSDHGGEGLQIVGRTASMGIDVHDWRDRAGAEREAALSGFLRKDRSRGFDLGTPPLCRLALFRTGDDCYECVWTYHHLILDGWSAYRVLNEVFACYGAFCAGRELPSFRRSPPYAEYIAWIQRQDLARSELFWRNALEGFGAPTRLPSDAGAGQSANVSIKGGEDHDALDLSLSATDADELRAFARRHRLTLNTVVQGAWALMLDVRDRSNDVLFGATVTGRPAELPDVESMVGPFINTVPVRVRIRSDQPLSEWLGALQEQQAARQMYEFTPLSRIREWIGTPDRRQLFESILVFENFPTDFSLDQQHSGLELSNVRSTISEQYPLVLVALPGRTLTLELKYQRSRLDAAAVTQMVRGLEAVLTAMTGRGDSTVEEIEEVRDRALGDARRRAHLERKESNAEKLRAMRSRTPGTSADADADA